MHIAIGEDCVMLQNYNFYLLHLRTHTYNIIETTSNNKAKQDKKQVKLIFIIYNSLFIYMNKNMMDHGPPVMNNW